ncbi:MAG: aspartyl-phosphate phosphatase Spo0E family protein [Firmicutes bacterium]|nr:aspartyl-phosphate phosphatase Spo0E family protein [Bacillota bacterium]
MLKSKKEQINLLKQEIARVRQHLQNLWNIRGYTDQDVLKASLELDLLINKYLRLWQEEPQC